jgi:Integrase core domain/GAG-pre-integrase domain
VGFAIFSPQLLSPSRWAQLSRDRDGTMRSSFSATGEGALQNIEVQEYMDLKGELDELKDDLSRSQSGASQIPHAQQGSQVSANLATSNEKWKIDSGATTHFCCMKHLFSNFQLHNQPDSVSVADGSSIPIYGEGSVSTPIARLNQVSFRPDIPSNTISVSALTKSLSCSATFFSNHCIFQDLTTGNLLGSGYEEKGQYILEDSIVRTSSCGLGSFISESLELLHYRLGHLHPKKLCMLFPELPLTKEEFRCTVCVRAKQIMSHYPDVKSHSTIPFEIVHSDIWGPFPVTSVFGYKYYVCFVDDCSHYTTIFLIKSKSEVALIFPIYHKMIQTQFGATIKILRPVNGSEYLSSELQKYLELHGIRSQTCYSYTPQQNGVTERKNRHILEVTRSLLIGMNVPKYLWSEAMLSAVYLINRMPTDILNGKTPLQIVDPKSVLFHMPLKVFGCVCFVHIKGNKHDKLDSRVVKCVFTGYSSSQKGYKCFDPITKHRYISMDIIFVENQSYFDSDSREKEPKQSKPTEMKIYVRSKRKIVLPNPSNSTEQEGTISQNPKDTALDER